MIRARQRAPARLRAVTRLQFHHLVIAVSSNISHFSLLRLLELILVILLNFGRPNVHGAAGLSVFTAWVGVRAPALPSCSPGP